MRRVAVLAASGRELAPVLSVFGLFGITAQDHIGRFSHRVGQVGSLELHLVETGIGPERAREASEAALFSVTPDALISTGYAGSLGVAAIGELVLGTQILDWTKERSSAPMCSSHALLEDARRAAREAGVGWTPGSVVTVDKVVWRASEKRALGEVSGAVAVDMESAAIAKVASAAGLPFLVARTISDRAEEDLPMDFNLWFSPYGSWRCLAEIARHPSILKGLFELNRQVSAASEGLRRFFCKLVPILEAHAPSPESATIGAR